MYPLILYDLASGRLRNPVNRYDRNEGKSRVKARGGWQLNHLEFASFDVQREVWPVERHSESIEHWHELPDDITRKDGHGNVAVAPRPATSGDSAD